MADCRSVLARRSSVVRAASRLLAASHTCRHLSLIFSSPRCDDLVFSWYTHASRHSLIRLSKPSSRMQEAAARTIRQLKIKVKAFPYSIPSVGPGADPGVQAVCPQVTVSHPPCGRLPLLFARPAVTSPAAEHHRPLAGTKLYCLVTEAHRCEQLAQGCYAALPRVGFEPATY